GRRPPRLPRAADQRGERHGSRQEAHARTQAIHVPSCVSLRWLGRSLHLLHRALTSSRVDQHALFDDLLRLQHHQRRDRQAERLILLRTVSCPEDKQEEAEEKNRPHIVAGGLLTRGPPTAEPSEAPLQSAPARRAR